MEAGFSDDMISHRRKQGRWRRLHQGVYALVSVPQSWMQEVWAAALAGSRPLPTITDVAVTHGTALLVHGADPSLLPRRPISLTAPNGRHPRAKGVVIHQMDDLAAHHVVAVTGLPVASPARAIVDISAIYGRHHLGLVLDEMVRSRKLAYAEVSARLAEVARPGKPGIVTAAQVLDERGPGHVPPHSELERRLFEVVARAGLPEPTRQYPLPGNHPTQEFADAAYPDAMVLIEADGRRWHTRIRELERDHVRDAEASEAGWVVLRFTYEQITTAPEWVATRIANVLATRCAQLLHT